MEKEVQHTADQFGVKVVSFEKQVRVPSHVQRTQRQKEPRQANGCNLDRRKNLALVEGLRLRRLCETHRDERHPKVPIRDGMRMAERTICGVTSQKDHRTGPTQVWMHRTLPMPRTMLSENSTRTLLWQRAGEATRRRSFGLGTEGLAANVTRVLKRLGWTWTWDKKWRKIHITQSPEGHWKHKIRSCTRTEAPTINRLKGDERLGEG